MSSRSTFAQKASRCARGRRSISRTTGSTDAASASGACSASNRLSAPYAASTLPCRVSSPALCCCGSCTSCMLTEDRPAAAQTPEADRRHHRRPCRGRGHRLVGRRLNEGRVLLLGYVPLLPLSLQGTVELQDGHQGCCGGATGRRLRSECSGAPSERLRRFGSDARPACSTILCIGRGQQTAKSWHVGM